MSKIKSHRIETDRNVSEVFLQDCLEALYNYADNHFDIAIVDPPYGINASNMRMGTHGKYVSTAKNIKDRLNSGGGTLSDRALNTMNCDWDKEPPTEEYFNQLFRVSKNQIIWGGNYFDLPPTRCIICWDKCQSWVNFSQWEMAWTSFDMPAKMYGVPNTGGANDEKKIHPTQKKVEIYDHIYRDFVLDGDIVLDTHLGSGSNRITAFKKGVDFVAFETHEHYFNSQNKRYEKFIEQPRLL